MTAMLPSVTPCFTMLEDSNSRDVGTASTKSFELALPGVNGEDGDNNEDVGSNNDQCYSCTEENT